MPLAAMLSLSVIPYAGSLSLDPQQPIVAARQSRNSSGAGLATNAEKAKSPTARTGYGSAVSPRPWLERRHVSFASPLSPPAKDLSFASTLDDASDEERRLGIRLAADDILVPAIDRCLEVKTLLFDSARTSYLRGQLQNLFHGRRDTSQSIEHIAGIQNDAVDDWAILKTLLTETTREHLVDRAWLTALCAIIAPRSAKLWCSLCDCLGTTYLASDILAEIKEHKVVPLSAGVAYDLLKNEDDKHVGKSRTKCETSVDEAARCALDDGSISRSLKLDTQITGVDMEVLHDVPVEYRKSPAAYCRNRPALQGDPFVADLSSDVGAIDIPQSRQRKPSSSSVASCTSLSMSSHDEIRTVLESSKNQFAGLRLHLGQPQSSCISPMPSVSPTVGITRSRSLSGEALQRSNPVFKKFRGLSTMFLSGNREESNALATDQTKAHGGARHPGVRRYASLHSSISTRESVNAPPETKVQDQSHKKAASLAETPAAKSPVTEAKFQSKLTDPCFNMSCCTDKDGTSTSGSASGGDSASDESEGASVSRRKLLGLMPDGRTRHPSSSSQDSQALAAREAFRKELALSTQEPKMHRSSELWSPLGAQDALSPLSLSCSSVKTPSESHPLLIGGHELSPFGLGIDEDEELLTPSSSVGPTSPEIFKYKLTRQSLPLSQISGNIQPGTFSKMEEPSLKSVSKRRSHEPPPNDFWGQEDHEAKSKASRQVVGEDASSLPASSAVLVFPIPPNTRYSRVHELTLRLDEAQSVEQPAWRKVYAAVGEKGMAHLKKTIAACGERCDASDEAVVERLARSCFDLVDMQPSLCHDASTAGKSQQDRDAALDTYLCDIDGYEQRWRAFRTLLSDIWLVEDAVVRKVQERCGPAQRLDLGSHKTNGNAKQYDASTSSALSM